MSKIKYTILIPCLNENETISRSILDAEKNAKKYLDGSFEIVVADNGSTDGSIDIILGSKARIIKVPVRGYGAALHWGITHSKGEYIIFADADLSYPFSNLRKFITVSDRNPDLVLGSRYKGRMEKGAMPFLHKYFGTPVLTFLINMIYGIRSTDCNSGMRMVKKSHYLKLNMTSSGMEWASELLIKTALVDGAYEEIPIAFKKDKRGKSAHLNTWSDGWRHLKAIILLKPQSLHPILALFFLLAIMYYPQNYLLVFIFANLFVVLLLSLLALHLLGSIINKKETPLSKFLLTFKLVPITIVFSVLVGIFVYIIPDSRMGSKLFLLSILGIIFMWIFFIETIKTHLVSKLSNEK